jgi:hypothetical protein
MGFRAAAPAVEAQVEIEGKIGANLKEVCHDSVLSA